MPDDKFSRLCTRIRRVQIAGAQAWDDMAAFGAPTECGALVADGLREDFREVLDDAGFTPTEFLRELESRTSARVVYFEFGEILDLAAGWPEPAEEVRND